MARTTQTIYDGMITDLGSGDYPQAKAAFVSVSKTAIFRLIFWICAKAINLFETILDNFKADIVAAEAKAVWGTVKWMQQKTLNFQYGDDILFDANSLPYYANVDQSKCVVGRCSITEQADGTVLVKAVHADGTALLAGEQSGLASYLDKIFYVRQSIVSLNPDKIRITGPYYFDPQNAEADVLADIENQVNTFLQNIDYNGGLYASRLNAVFTNCRGYVDAGPLTIEVNMGGVWTDIGRLYTAASGDFVIDDVYTLATTLTLIADVLP